MTIYVDDETKYPDHMIKGAARKWGRTWSHMWTDQDDPEELHVMAENLGLKRSYYQTDHPELCHYDIIPSKRKRAILLGAQQISVADFIRLRNGIQ